MGIAYGLPQFSDKTESDGISDRFYISQRCGQFRPGFGAAAL